MLKRIVSLFFSECAKEGIRCERAWSETPEEGIQKFKQMGQNAFIFTTVSGQQKIDSGEFTDIWVSNQKVQEAIRPIINKYPYINPLSKPISTTSEYIITVNPLRLLG